MSAAPIRDTDIQPRAEEILKKVADELLAGSRVITAFKGTSEGLNEEIQFERFVRVLTEWLCVEFPKYRIDCAETRWAQGTKRGAEWRVTVSTPTEMDQQGPYDGYRELELPASNIPGCLKNDELY